MDFVYVGSLQVLRSLKVMVISRDADNGFLALITFSAEFTDTDTDTDTGNLHTHWLCMAAANHMPQLKQYCSWMFKREDWEVTHLHKLIEKEYENHTIQMPVNPTISSILVKLCTPVTFAVP